MSYALIAIADGASIAQTDAAKNKYLETIETSTGGPHRVLSCFQAWSKGLRQDLGSLSDDEAKLSAAWLLADESARASAAPLLDGAREIDFLFFSKRPEPGSPADRDFLRGHHTPIGLF